MKNFKFYSLVLVLGLTLIPLTTSAQTADPEVGSSTTTSSSKNEPGFGGFFHDLRTNVRQDREAMRARIDINREKSKEERREIVEKHTDNMKGIINSSTTASTTRSLLKDERENFKQELSDFRKTRITNFTDKMFSRLSAAFNRFDQITSRLDNKVTELEAKKIDVTAAKTALTEAKTAISEGKVSLADAQAKAQAIGDSSSPKAALSALKEATSGVINQLVVIQEKLNSSISALKTASSTPVR